ncbi:MAG: hypothetical protein ACR2JB_06020 [Bryobacteraceae bacterium]
MMRGLSTLTLTNSFPKWSSSAVGGAATGMGGGPNDHGETMQDQLLKAVLDMSGILGGASNPYATAHLLRKERARR